MPVPNSFSAHLCCPASPQADSPNAPSLRRAKRQATRAFIAPSGDQGEPQPYACSARAGGHERFPLARSAARAGELARAECTPLYALQEMGGWESPEMVRPYAHLAADHLASLAERLCALRAYDF